MFKYLYHALVRPASRRQAFTPLRDILRWPVLFDLVSLVAQLRDMQRTAKIQEKYSVDDPHHRMVQDYNAGVTITKKLPVPAVQKNIMGSSPSRSEIYRKSGC